MHSITLFLSMCLVHNSVKSDFVSDRKDCIKELNLDKNTVQPSHPPNFEISPILQYHNLQCLDRCILIKRGLINENETLQEEKIKEQFPSINNIITKINQTCPIISNLTDKCDKAYVISHCIQAQVMHIMHQKPFRPRPPPFPANQWQKYRSECKDQIAKENFNASADYEATTGLQSEWCLRRCMLIKRGILNEKNEIQEANVQKFLFDDDKTDFHKCTSIKNENICREAADIDLCINILTHKF